MLIVLFSALKTELFSRGPHLCVYICLVLYVCSYTSFLLSHCAGLLYLVKHETNNGLLASILKVLVLLISATPYDSDFEDFCFDWSFPVSTVNYNVYLCFFFQCSFIYLFIIIIIIIIFLISWGMSYLLVLINFH